MPKTRNNRRKTRKGGMLKNIARPLGKAAVSLGESYGKDYLQNKSTRVAEGVYNDPSLLKNPGFMLTGNQPTKQPTNPYNIQEDKENRPYNKAPVNNQLNVGLNYPLDLGGGRRKSKKTKKMRK